MSSSEFEKVEYSSTLEQYADVVPIVSSYVWVTGHRHAPVGGLNFGIARVVVNLYLMNQSLSIRGKWSHLEAY